jgi:hypothetical protein
MVNKAKPPTTQKSQVQETHGGGGGREGKGENLLVEVTVNSIEQLHPKIPPLGCVYIVKSQVESLSQQ